jgi:hypothetical protein
MDIDGVSLAAIKGLYSIVKNQRDMLESIIILVKSQQEIISALEKKIRFHHL